MKNHNYTLQVIWTGSNDVGTMNYKAYRRDFEICISNKPTLQGSSDRAFRGDVTRYNPEDMLLASLASCHMLWYLHLCADAGIVVLAYTDNPTATMIELENGGGMFQEATLHPEITITRVSDKNLALELHHLANEKCFIANSVNFKIYHQPTINIKENV